MLCEKPFTTAGGAAYGCGMCPACRINRVRLWQHRILLEAKLHEHNAFVTLTYADEKVPADGSLNPEDVQLWLKKLRRRAQPDRIRYFLCGEYGERTWRPHYHAILFGFPTCTNGQSQYSRRRTTCCVWCDMVRDTWGHGLVSLGSVEQSSAGYVCGYVTKKMTSYDDPRLDGKHPEFARMSLRPGIGHDAMFEVADALLRYDKMGEHSDVPPALLHGGSPRSLGRYLRTNLRKMVGMDGKAPQATLDDLSKKMRPLQEAARSNEADPSFRSAVVKANQGARDAMYSRRRIFKQRRTI